MVFSMTITDNFNYNQLTPLPKEATSLSSANSAPSSCPSEAQSQTMQIRHTLISTISSEDNFASKSTALVGELRKLLPVEMGKLETFCKENQGKITQLKESQGWNGLKKTEGAMTKRDNSKISMEEFRKETVDHVVFCCISAMKAMGFDPPGKHSATGTPGWNSDIDTVYSAPPGMPEELQTAEKIMFDMLFQGILGETPGVLFDTESYLDHAGAVLNTGSQVTSAEGKAGFSRLELNGSSIQMLRQCGGVGSPKWENYKEQQLTAAITPTLRESLAECYDDIEKFESDVESGISKQLLLSSGVSAEDISAMSPKEINEACKKISTANPEARKQASMSYKSKGLMEVSRMMDSCKAEIAKIQQRTISTAFHETLQPQQKEIEQKERKNLEREMLKLGNLYLLRTSFFDEGYNTQGSFIKVCFNKEGQMHQRSIENFQKNLQQGLQQNRSINELIAEGSGFKLGKAQTKKSSPEQNAASAQENLAMYKGHYDHKVHEGTLKQHQNAVIATSKYSERTLQANQELLDSLIKKNPDLSKDQAFSALAAKNQELLFKSGELEKVKRGNQLNYFTTEALIFDVLQGKVPKEKQGQLRQDIKTAMMFSEKLVNRFKYEESLTPQDKHDAILSQLAGLGYVKILEKPDAYGFAISDNSAINDIVKARVGTPSALNDRELSSLHSKSSEVTLKELQFDHLNKIEAFNSEMEIITTSIYNLMVKQGVVSEPGTGMGAELSLRYLWQQASPIQEEL